MTDLADVTGQIAALSEALVPLRSRDYGHDPGRIAVDLATMLADGGEAITDPAVLRGQAGLFGPVASDPTDLFDAVLADQVEGILDDAPLTADDLPGYAVSRYDAYLSHPGLCVLPPGHVWSARP